MKLQSLAYFLLVGSSKPGLVTPYTLAPPPEGLVISEINPSPLDDGQDQYIELYNRISVTTQLWANSLQTNSGKEAALSGDGLHSATIKSGEYYLLCRNSSRYDGKCDQQITIDLTGAHTVFFEDWLNVSWADGGLPSAAGGAFSLNRLIGHEGYQWSTNLTPGYGFLGYNEAQKFEKLVGFHFVGQSLVGPLEVCDKKLLESEFAATFNALAYEVGSDSSTACLSNIPIPTILQATVISTSSNPAQGTHLVTIKATITGLADTASPLFELDRLESDCTSSKVNATSSFQESYELALLQSGTLYFVDSVTKVEELLGSAESGGTSNKESSWVDKYTLNGKLDYLGSVMSSNGSVLVTPSLAKFFHFPEKVELKTFHRQDDEGWIEVGTPFVLEHPTTRFESSVTALSGDGSTFALRAPAFSQCPNIKIFRWDESDWAPMGSPVVNSAPPNNNVFSGDCQGYRYEYASSLSLSNDGTTLAIGTGQGSDASSTIPNAFGYVAVHRWDGQMWSQLGSNIVGQERYGLFGKSVSLSDDGSIIAIGAPGLQLNIYPCRVPGNMLVFKFNGTDWDQLGDDIRSCSNSSCSGQSVSMAGDGSRVALGAPFDFDGFVTGLVGVYSWSGTQWTQMGNDIRGGSAANERFGARVILSEDGDTLAAGENPPLYTRVGPLSNQTRFYRWNGTEWEFDQGMLLDVDVGYALAFSGDLSTTLAYDSEQETAKVLTVPKTPVFGVVCFSGDTTVVSQRYGEILMKNLEQGDKILTAPDAYEAVYSFGHRSKSNRAVYLQFWPSKLEVSDDHMVFIDDKSAIPAAMLKIGDRILNGEIITHIRKVHRKGAYAPFTPSGRIMVNGVSVSSYVAFQKSKHLMVGGNIGTPLSYQWLAHSFQFPHRLWCHYLGHQCVDHYTIDGLSTWVELPLQLSKWWLNECNKHMVSAVLVLPLLTLLSLSSVVEAAVLCIEHQYISAAPLLLLAALLLLVWSVTSTSCPSKKQRQGWDIKRLAFL